jgi:transaldolase/glucose-6-phosphate isomerase
VADEPVYPPDGYGADRFFVAFSLDRDASAVVERTLRALEEAGHPVARIRLRDTIDLGQEMFRWELAVAGAGAVLGIHPFNQPDVQLAKDLASKAMSQKRGDVATDRDIASIDDEKRVAALVREWMGSARGGDYVGIQAYLAPNDATTARLQQLRGAIANTRPLATTLGYGPRFLHSTGQLHKGGPDSGLFLQLVDEPVHDVAVPETDFTFGALIRAQAQGDYGALKQRKRRVLRINLGREPLAGIATLIDVLD